MKNIIHPILILISFLFFFQALQGKGVHGLYSKQEPKSKMVTLTYTLIIDQDETAKIEFLFSSDDGVTYSPCSTITGDVGDSVTTGRKTATWDAGADWDDQFTTVGRFKLIYSLNVEPALDFSVIEVPFQASGVFESPSFRIKDSFTYMKTQTFAPGLQSLAPGVPKKYFVDKWEVTNGQWDKVVEWAVKHGYDLEKAPADTKPNYPRVSISMNEVVKWLNARSEMEGLTPAFYLDPVEGVFDVNDNGRMDLGLKIVFRKGRITEYLSQNNRRSWGFVLRNHLEIGASGYRLPSLNGLVPFENDGGFENGRYEDGEFWYLAMGGRKEGGDLRKYSDHVYSYGRMAGWWEDKTGLVYIEEWPWGSVNPSGKKDLSDSVSVGTVGKVNQRSGNKAGLQDMIGNVSEMTLNWKIDYISSDAPGAEIREGEVQVVGGNPRGTSTRPASPREVMSVGEEVSAGGGQMVGFRAIRVQY